MRPTLPLIVLGVLGVLLPAAGAEPASASPARHSTAAELVSGFETPPDAARPWVYWFWLNGNITREGITADLEAMKRVGIGGVLIMEVDQGVPLGAVSFLGAEWRALFRHVVSEAERLGLEVNMNNDAGWNGSGGPWIRPEESMQKVVWTETQVEGPRRFEGGLAQPEVVAGFYREIACRAFPATGDFRIEGMPSKAAWQIGAPGPAEARALPTNMVIDRARTVDLSGRLDAEGRLSWDVPEGAWTIVRFGHTSTGAENAPSPASGRGLECDKLSPAGIEAQFAGMMAKLIDDVGPSAGKTLVATHIDSWENGSQNWTLRMREEFRARRGYDLFEFLPVFTGRVVDSLEVSERFLWDLRRTVSELVIENYAGRLGALARAKGLRLSIEAYGSPCDHLPYAGRADEPMCEFWIGGSAFETVKGMASAAHAYGRPILGAEAFTAGDGERWLEHPASLKALGDRAFADGVNRFVFHRYALQPWGPPREETPSPGMTMGPWGIHYERTQTWWEETSDWHRYLARCQFLLREGLFVADVAFLEAEESPAGLAAHRVDGHDYDVVPPEVVLDRMRVEGPNLVLPDGMSYRLLVLPERRTMTPALLERIGRLVREGASVLGPPPLRSPSLAGFPECDEEVRRLAKAIWGPVDGVGVREGVFGKGRVAWGLSPEAFLRTMGVAPDFVSRARLRRIHRRVGDLDLYFVANTEPYPARAPCTFRVTGKVPELWWPLTGRIEPAAVYEMGPDATKVYLALEPSDSVFVVFRPPMEREVGREAVAAVSAEGMPPLLASEPAPKITIERAVYGVPGEAARSRDVRAEVESRVAVLERRFPVSDLAQSGDPAHGSVKTLTIDYTLDGRPLQVSARDGALVSIGERTGVISIVKAVYGVPGDPERTRDVREKVQRIADAGETSFQVARLAAGDDPAYLVVKTLVVEGTIDGRPFTATGTDPDLVSLAVPESLDRALSVRSLASGRHFLEIWKPGRYEVRWASGRSRVVSLPALPPPSEISGPWRVRFPEGKGAPAAVELAALSSLSKHADPGVKYFSGEAVYATTFVLPSVDTRGGEADAPHTIRTFLALGRVEVMARVRLNDRDLGLLWRSPYTLDVTEALVAGENRLELRVTNLWPARMVGDEELPEDSSRYPDGRLVEWPKWLLDGKRSPTGRFSFTAWRLWRKGAPLGDSGLLGPVRLVRMAKVAID